MTIEQLKMEKLTGFLVWSGVGAIGYISKNVWPVLVIALVTGVVNELGKGLGVKIRTYLETKFDGKHIALFISIFKRKNKTK